MNSHATKASIIKYWRMIEFFLPQKIPALNPTDRTYPTYKITQDDLSPWDIQHPLQKLKGNDGKKVLRHVIYAGIYPIDKIREKMEATFGKDPDTFDARSGGETCVFSIQISDEGRPLFDSFVLSACAWALSRLKKPGPVDKNWLAGFEQGMEDLKNALEKKYALQNEDKAGLALRDQGYPVGTIITISELLEGLSLVTKTLEIEDLDIKLDHVVVKSYAIKKYKHYDVEDVDFLNSFFIKDLHKVSSAVEKGEISEPLAHYLQDTIDISQRMDVRKYQPIEKFTHLVPNEFPRGCWPASGFYPLAYAQQLAVNSVFKQLSTQSGLFSVNGPPGTGKTTLLRDLVAGVVVERARKLVEFTSPEEAFSGKEQWKTDNKTQEIFTWKENLSDFGMVVASSNNSAVENITIEIPLQKAIDETYLNEVNYFADIATELVNNSKEKEKEKEKEKKEKLVCWALLSAKLGNKANRTEFINTFWNAFKPTKPKETSNTEPEPEKPSFYKFLTDTTQPVSHWQEARISFKDALAEEHSLRQYRQMLFEKQKMFLEQGDSLTVLHDKIYSLQIQKLQIEEKIKQQQDTHQNHEEAAKAIHERRLQHRQFKPSIMDIIFSLGKAYQPWHEKDLTYQQQITDLEKIRDGIACEIKQHGHTLTTLQKEIRTFTDQLMQWQENQDQLQKAKVSLGKHFPDLNLLEDEEALERSSLWIDDAWFQARVKVFLAALNLHRVFIENNKKTFLTNLTGAMDLLSGKGQNAMCTAAIRSAWATLFFVVPVISTTFASFDRLFSQLDPSSLGWLFIDEAGQATPQAAVGALWRSKRVVVVGDPLQLEPILTIPMTAQEALRKHAGVAETWLPKRVSVQSLSDRVNPLGTYLPTKEGEAVWIGAPLRVHRRCDNPMFHIANQIAYDGMMVFGTPSQPPLFVKDSCWIHVESATSNGHWIEAEGAAVRQLLSELLKTFSENDIAMISPFTEVVKGLRNLRTSVNAGTIHTMQGKESSVIILVLGGNPNKPGAKDWAAEKPNMLNVAVSRAKRRLYVVGNRNTWSTRPYFRELSEWL